MIKFICAKIITGATLSLLFCFSSYSCPMISPPVEVSNIFDLANTDGQFLTAVATCDGCESESFNEVTMEIVGSNQTLKVDAWLVNNTYKNHGSFMKNFDPWHSWGNEPEGCGMAPIVRNGYVYDIFVQEDKVVWLDRHDPYMISFFSSSSDFGATRGDYYETLAWELFRNASEYWTCDNRKRPYRFFAVNTSQEKTGRMISHNALHNPPSCKDGPVIGLTIASRNDYALADWYYQDGEVMGYKIKDAEADAKIKHALKKYFEVHP